jgi:U3 small nucleolar RNA-associated protein 21
MFSGASNIDSYASGKEVVNVKLPSLSSVEGSNVENEDTEKPIVNQSVSNEVSTFPAFSQQIPDLVTLSLLPKSQWQSLINLDIIKVPPPFSIHLIFSAHLVCNLIIFSFNLISPS